MEPKQVLGKARLEFLAMAEAVFSDLAEPLVRAAQRMTEALRSGGKVVAFGNGGSAADAQHLAAELVGRFRLPRRPLPAIALSTDTSVLTAIANDFGFDRVFETQLRALARPGDLAVAISTSGRSANVVRAARAARELGIFCLALSGGEGRPLAEIADQSLLIPSQDTARIQEGHALLCHLLCELVDQALS